MQLGTVLLNFVKKEMNPSGLIIDIDKQNYEEDKEKMMPSYSWMRVFAMDKRK